MKTTFDEIRQRLHEAGCDTPCTAVNDDGENIIIVAGKDEAGEYYQIITSQSNGWLRVNTYYKSGDQTESYKR